MEKPVERSTFRADPSGKMGLDQSLHQTAMILRLLAEKEEKRKAATKSEAKQTQLLI